MFALMISRTSMKAFADDGINVAENLKFFLGRVENIVRKGENSVFSKGLLYRVVTSHACVVELRITQK